ncbi:TetR/AcrR family transcriptional regulator [Neptunomonas antarctica]|uniref:Transcriptional regulator, TetR family n=1 Tax=Neptunomonas antarctica TaxID=619304 RepID=A0A1N7M0F8_9GAMM|nr:TetR/AcrR family transcriptional regulator [Neptunomonas antarctica]SIS79590.1 transcriptional regulator, TetR family [Neptunomonas antarctica]
MKDKKSYHHGDLRKTLVDTATDIIRGGGVESLSMRKLADQVSVSRTAPYHHFKDKNALLCAIAEQGFLLQDLTVKQMPADYPDFSAAALFEHYVLTYIRFANEHPETYDLMFGREIWKTGKPTESLKTISKSSFRRWVEWIAQLQQQDLFDRNEPALRIAQASWAALHGLCRLFNDGIYVNRDDLEAIAKTTVKMLIQPKK